MHVPVQGDEHQKGNAPVTVQGHQGEEDTAEDINIGAGTEQQHHV